MNWPEIFLICFGVGSLWAVVSFLMGGVHLGHVHHAGAAHHMHGHAHGSHTPGWIASLLNPSCVAVFLAWFGGTGYLLTKYSGWLLWLNLAIAGAFGLAGAVILARFLGWLMKHERPMNPADYDMVGVLGRVSSAIRADGVGEVIYQQDGARRSLSAKSEGGMAIGRGEEVIVTRFEKGIAYVRTWEAMTQPVGGSQPGNIA